jgi:HK97 family phage major capsid protein
MAKIMVRVGDVDKTIEEARSRLDDIQKELNAIHDEAGDNDLDAEQRSTWEQLDKEHETLAIAVRKAERRQRLAESNERWNSVQVGVKRDDPFEGDARTISEPQALSRARAVLDSKEHSAHLRSDQKEQIERALRTRNGDLDGDLIARLLLATENPYYRSAFQKVAASATPAFSPEESRAIEQVRLIKRAMSIGSDSSGGFAVPVLIDPTIIMTAQGSANDLLRLARVETITNDTWRGLSSAGVSWRFGAEASTATDNSPSLAQPEVPTRRADGFIPFSIEVGMDWPGFAESMSELLSEGYDELLAEKLVVATGANEPGGMIAQLAASTNPNVSVPVGTAATIAASDIYGLWAELPDRFRRAANCAWMSATDIQNSIRQLGTVDPNFTVDITQEAIPRMFGRQYPMNDFMEDLPSGTGTEPLLVVGDFRGYVVAQRAGMTVEFIPMLFDVTNNRPTGQRGWFAWARVGGGVVNPYGFRLLINKSS